MKKYLKILPLILYPYINHIWAVLWFLLMYILNEYDIGDVIPFTIYFILFVVFQIYMISTGIVSVVKAAKGKINAYESATMNVLIKGCHIPAYIINFVVGMLTPIAGHFGLIAGVFIFFADVMAISMSGLFAISCAVAFRKENIQTTARSVITGILSFIFCVDVAVAIYYFIKTSKTIKAGKNVIKNYIPPENITNSEFQGDTQ